MQLISKTKSTTKVFGHIQLEICFLEINSLASGCQFKLLIDMEPDVTRKALTTCSNVVRYRSSHGRCSVRKGVLRTFTKFTGKHLCQSLFFNKKTLTQVFSCKFCL